MPKLFGIDIAKEVNDGIRAAGNLRPLTLTKITPGTRVAGSLTAGTAPTSANYTGYGFVEDGPGTQEHEGTLTQVRTRSVSILGDSLSGGVRPDPNDTVTFNDADGGSYRLGPVTTDPADALFVSMSVEQ